MTKIKLRNNIESIPQLYDHVVKFCVEHNLPKYLWHDISLILDEAVTNSIRYGFSDGEKGDILVSLLSSDGKTSIRIIDRGSQFNPLNVPDPDTKSSIEKRRVGGLGVYLIKKLSQRVSYNYKWGANVLTVQLKAGEN